MKKHKVKYTDEPIGKIKIIDDFLPKPQDLILKKRKPKLLYLSTWLKYLIIPQMINELQVPSPFFLPICKYQSCRALQHSKRFAKF